MNRALEFPPFRLDPGDQRLWRGDRPLKLRPKTFEVLAYLVARAPALVSQDELLTAAWGDVAVSPGTLSQSITELRRALDDDTRKPRFIETVHRRGYRFVAAVRSSGLAESSLRSAAPGATGQARWLVGRKSELGQLEASLQAAETGRRQIVFVTGEPGIGKTSLVGSFLRKLSERDGNDALSVTVGKCVELHGESEAYMPVLNALDRLARDGGDELRSALARFAPSWLPHLPRLAAGDGEGQPAAADLRSTPARMRRELCIALEELTRDRTLVLWLEDLHWGDDASVDLLAALARREDPARLMVLASYRPVDAAIAGHAVAALKRSVVQQGEGLELALEPLDEPDVGTYLRGRFAWEQEPVGLARAIHEQSEGNPLFMVTLANRIAADAGATHPGVAPPPEAVLDIPRTLGTETLRGLVETQIARMSPEDVEVLEAGSIAGQTFAAQSVAAALGVDELWVEKSCGRLAGWELFLEDAGEGRWPDGSTGERYAFLHDVFRRVLYDRIPAARRQQLHRRIGERLAIGYASPTDAPAAELAVHFERGGDPASAVAWLERAAAGVRRRFADREAIDYLERALALLSGQPACEERDRKELSLRLELAEALLFAAGIAPEPNIANLKRALVIANRLDDPTAAMTVLTSLVRVYWISPDLAEATVYLEPLLALESRVDDGPLRAHAHANASIVAAMNGDLPRARRAAKVALELLAEEENTAIRFVTSDPGVQTLYSAALAEWLMGRPAHAEAQSRRGVERAPDPYRRVASLLFHGHLAGLLRSIDQVDHVDRELERLQEEYGFGLPYVYEPIRKGWLLWQRGDSDAAIACLQEGLLLTRATGVGMHTTFLLATLADVRLARGEAEEGFAAIEEAFAFAEKTGERYLEAELHRLRGELLLLEPRVEAATEAFERALAIARRQGARALELRAATSHARLLKQEGRKAEARDLLSSVYAGFTEGLETPDLQDAAALLNSL